MTESRFDDFAAEFSQTKPADYADLLARRAAKGAQVAELLRSHLDSRCPTSARNARSNIHNNGFVKLALWRHPETQASIRVHVWQPHAGDRVPAPSVHDHRWDFASMVIAGRLHFANYDERECADGTWILRQVSDADADGSKQTRRSTRCELRETCSYELGPGLVHALDHRQLHRTPAPRSYAATLVLIARPARNFSRVAKPLSQDPEGRLTQSRALEPAEICRHIEEIIGRSDAAPRA